MSLKSHKIKINLLKYLVRFHSKHLVLPKVKFISWFFGLYTKKYCWTDCVSWAYTNDRWNPFNIEKSKACESESSCHTDNACYCGVWVNGICFSALSKTEREVMRKIRDKELETSEIPF